MVVVNLRRFLSKREAVDCIGMHHDNICESPEVGVIEGRQVRDIVFLHRRNKPRVMRGRAAQFLLDDKALPAIKNGPLVPKDVELLNDLCNVALRFGWRHPQSILGDCAAVATTQYS